MSTKEANVNANRLLSRVCIAFGKSISWSREKRFLKKGLLTGTIFIHDVNTKLEAVVLVQLEWLTLGVLMAESLAVEEGAVAGLEVPDIDLSCF